MDAQRLSELIARAQNRDPEAFDEIVESYSSRLYGYLYRFTGSRPDAEDLLQELFVRVVRMIGSYEHDGRFESWLFRIAGNLVRDRVRRAKTSRVIEIEGDGEDDSNLGLAGVPDPKSTTPEEALQRAEEIDELQRAIGNLSESEREVILLRHYAQMTFKEIAELMGTPLGTALARAHRGLARLRELMESDAKKVSG